MPRVEMPGSPGAAPKPLRGFFASKARGAELEAKEKPRDGGCRAFPEVYDSHPELRKDGMLQLAYSTRCLVPG
jgi:hypothetical protein